MRAARLYRTGDIRVADEPVPAAGAGADLVRVTAVGICGSDLHWWTEGAIGDATLARPLVLGHEGAGVIASGPRRGRRVAIDPAIPCEACRACRDGYRNLCYRIQFAGHGATDGMLRELMPWPARLLHPLPDSVSDAAGALLEPLGVALHALDLGHVPFGGTVAVIGCGPIGLLLVQLLNLAGARVLAVDPLAHRRSAASTFGAHEVSDAPGAPSPPEAPAPGVPGAGVPGAGDRYAGLPGSRPPGSGVPGAGVPSAGVPGAGVPGSGLSGYGVPEWGVPGSGLSGYGADVAFELAGNDAAVRAAMESVRPGGRVVLGGIPDADTTTFPASLARRKGLTIAMVRRMNEVYPRAIDLAARGAVSLDPLVSLRASLPEVAAAFAAAQRRTGLKVLVEP